MSEVVIYDLLRPENIRRTDAGLEVTEPGQGSGVVAELSVSERFWCSFFRFTSSDTSDEETLILKQFDLHSDSRIPKRPL